MGEDTAEYLEIGSGDALRRIAMISRPGVQPGLLWLCGFKSEMTATKATAVAAWANASGRAMMRFDYSGHGRSGGAFEAGTISRWLEEAAAVAGRTTGPLVLIGSSMGGWLALLLAKRLGAERLAGVVLIAPAVDMTETLIRARLTAGETMRLVRDGRLAQPSQYGPDPYVITHDLIEDGRKHLFGDRTIALPCPVRILHGQEDPDVPWRLSLHLAERLASPSVRLTFVKEGDHRLSRPEDIALLVSTISDVGGG